MARVELRNVQAGVHRQFREGESQHRFYHFPAKAAGQAFLAAIASNVMWADTDSAQHPDCVVTVGLTCDGLKTLGLSDAIRKDLDDDFTAGPNAVTMGDTGPSNEPRQWWHGHTEMTGLHMLVQLHSTTPERLAHATKRLEQAATATKVTELRPTLDGKPLSGRHLGGGFLHFGYRDGLTQPDIGYDDATRSAAQVDFRAFILGYSAAPYHSMPRSYTAANAFVKDGSYGVFRWLYQDVAAFNKFLTENAGFAPGTTANEREEWLASRLMGRWRDGTPVVLSPDTPDEAQAHAPFDYSNDPDGKTVPFAAHIRVVRPRDTELKLAVKLTSDPLPLVLRRGTPYGSELAGTADDGIDRGLIGLFLCTSINHQFYKIMNWMNNADIFDKSSESNLQDPFATRESTGPTADPEFTAATPSFKLRATLKTFTRTRGTALLLLPGRTSLAAIMAL